VVSLLLSAAGRYVDNADIAAWKVLLDCGVYGAVKQNVVC